MNRFTISLMVALGLALLSPMPAAAQQSELGGGGEQQRPWAKGVPQDKQNTALQLFREGNFLLKNSLFPRAEEKYAEALKLWDHPAIHYNMALALLNLNKPLQLHEHLKAAIRYGEAPLDADKLERAKTFMKLVEQQLAHVEITCDIPGTTVLMDNKELFVAPGRHEGFVAPGPHTFAAVKAGYPRNERERNLAGGENFTLPIKLYTNEELTRYSRRWAPWKSWAVVGAGAAVAAGGGLLHLQARNSFNSFDAAVKADCQSGCPLENDLADKRSSGENLQKIAVGTYAAGGAALLTGMVLLYVNRAQPYRVTPDELEQGASAAPAQPAVSVIPLVGGGAGGVLATFQF